MIPDDPHQLWAEARDQPPFSNGTEGDGWMDANCSTCIHDKPAREDDYANACPLLLIALTGRTPAQWLDGPRDERGLYSIAGQYRCIYYRHEDDGPGPEPTPIPDPPGQLTLMPRGRFEGHRMLTPTTDASTPTAVTT